MSKIKICYVLAYKSPGYVRTASLVKALSLIKNVELFKAINTHKGIYRYIETFIKFIRIKLTQDPDIYIIGFRGHEYYWLIRLFILNKIVIFDEMMSPYDSLLIEKKVFKPSSIISKVMFFVEKSIVKNADFVLTDTKLHSKFFTRVFNLDFEKFIDVPVGTDEVVFQKIKQDRNNKHNKTFNVFFYSTLLPLHGVDIVLKAAKQLEHLPIKFTIIGGKGYPKRLKKINSLINELDSRNVEHLDWVKFTDLPTYIQNADICLGGPYGNTPQGRRVITGKSFQFLSMGKATVLGKIDEDFGLSSGENCYLVEQGNFHKLADIIKEAYINRNRLEDIGNNGRKLFEERFSTSVIANKLEKLFKKIYSK